MANQLRKHFLLNIDIRQCDFIVLLQHQIFDIFIQDTLVVLEYIRMPLTNEPIKQHLIRNILDPILGNPLNTDNKLNIPLNSNHNLEPLPHLPPPQDPEILQDRRRIHYRLLNHVVVACPINIALD